MIAYKIFCDGELPRTLFHGHNGSRTLPLNTWLKANKKMVKNGSGVEKYESAFHAYSSLEDVKYWLTKLAKNIDNRVICKVNAVKYTWRLSGKTCVLLCDYVLIDSDDWAMRVPARVFLENNK